MKSARVLVVAVVLGFSSQLGSAQDLARYRDYVLESSLESVVAASRTRVADAKTLHERPAKIQELEWRVPYGSSEREPADPVQGAVFSFYDSALYQVVVRYHRGRTDGLSNRDVIESLTAVYGDPVLQSSTNRLPPALIGNVVLAQWDSPDSSLTLLRGAYSEEFQLLLVSKTLSAQARNAIREADRLDALEAPRRELEARNKQVADAADARDKLRTTNKAAFRP
jgi:hypothetical protein